MSESSVDTPERKASMKTITKLALVIAVATSAATGALAQDSATGVFKAAGMDMMKKMDTVPYTGNPDVDFRTHMIPHHEGAIAVAKVALQYAKDAETKRLAQSIIDAQEKEVAGMEAWLKKHGH
jgi:uncharacterized protein (DUF305 family)